MSLISSILIRQYPLIGMIFRITPFIKLCKNLTLLTILLFLTSNITDAQEYKLSSKDKKAISYYNHAATHYKNNNHNETIKYLNLSIERDANFIEARLLLGDIYSDLKRYDDAIREYNIALAIDSALFPPVYYFLANIYYKTGEYNNSILNYNKLLKFNSISKELRALATEKLIFADTAFKLISNPVKTNPINIGFPINTSNDEYINYVNTDYDLLMLTKRVKQPAFSSKRYKEDLYYTAHSNASWSVPQVVALRWRDDERNMGTINFSTDGRTMFFTGCYWPSGKGGCDLYFSERLGNVWLTPHSIGNDINTSTWESQPIISSDSKRLYFASKRSGGKGGSDIWMSIKLKNDTWSPPINLGDSINTTKDEMTPFLHADGKTLFFASNGHPGLGGYDLFISRQDELGRWSLASNVGYPTNSRFNDINIFSSIDGSQSWISSDREGGAGAMDIYVFENYQEILPKKIMYVEGVVIDKVTKIPLKAEVQITNLGTSEIINTTVSDSVTGNFLIVIFPGVDYAFTITKKGYLFFSENINLKDSIGVESIKKIFELSPFAKGNQLIMNNVFFEFNKYELLPSSSIELNKLVELLDQHPTSEIEIIGHTDSIGSADYNMTLSMHRAKSVLNYLISNGIDSERLAYNAMGQSQPVAPNSTEQGRAKNRRTEIVIK